MTKKSEKKKTLAPSIKSNKAASNLTMNKDTETVENCSANSTIIQFNNMKEEQENDNYIYGLHDEIVNKALQEIKDKKELERRVDEFVQSFCNAWIKLVKWRWMFRDDTGRQVNFEDKEPEKCPRDPWSTFTYGENVVRPTSRTTMQPPKKCNPHPQMCQIQMIKVEQPQLENAKRKKYHKYQTQRIREKYQEDVVETKDSEWLGVVAIPEQQPTAFPERAIGNISMKPGPSDKGQGKPKAYVTNVVLGQSEQSIQAQQQLD